MVRRRQWNTSHGDPHQGILEAALSTIFPTQNIIKNARKKVAIKNPLTGGYLEVDVWYPDLKICFEYQDDYHYQPSWYSHIPLDVVQEKDNIKKSKLLQKGETLILVPCWWDGFSASLRSTIKFHRPDLLPLQHTHSIIPANPPLDFFSDENGVGAKQLMLASFPSSPEVVEMTEHNTWWLGEKYDGVRCFWDPEEKQLYSRHKLKIDVHPSVNQKLFGHVVLDGEIWFGRGHFLESQILITTSPDKVYWALFRIVCFDEASWRMQDQQFEGRYSLILSHFPPEHSIVITAPRFSCTSVILLMNSLQQVIEGGGEGVILRRPHSLYVPGRSSFLMKVKATRSDQEALVVDVQEDGSLLLQLPNGTTFAVARVDCVLPRRAVRGDVVTFSHDFSRRASTHDPLAQDNTHHHHASGSAVQWEERGTQRHASTRDVVRGLPANIVVHRIRTDLFWEDVVSSAGLPVRQFQNESYQKIDDVPKPKGYWGAKNMRALLESVARKDGFDPLAAENWYSVNGQDFLQRYKEVHSLVRRFGSSLTTALVSLFPELDFDVTKFGNSPRNFWNSAHNRRALLEKFARSKGSDPLLPSFWYNLNPAELRLMKGASATFEYYEGYADTVVHLFPELHLDFSKFKQRTALSWKTESARRAFFDRFAASKGMDPRSPAFWSRVTGQDLRRYQPGYKTIVKYYGGRLSTCLMQLYPDIGLQQSHFGTVFNWNLKETRRSVLLQFAKTRSFDPLVAANWYQLSWSHFSAYHLTRSMLTHCYKKKFVVALMDLFPELNLKPSHFTSAPVRYWEDIANRIELFIGIARERGFDPLVPANWYPVSYASLINVKGVSSVLDHYYGGSLAQGLIDMFPNIGLVQSEFQGGKEWEQEGARRWYLESVAKKHAFDPLLPSAWASFLSSEKTSRAVYRMIGRILARYPTTAKALVTLFPQMRKQKLPKVLHSKFPKVKY